MAYDLEAALAEYGRWGYGSAEIYGRETVYQVLRLSDGGWRQMAGYDKSVDALDAYERLRLEASIKAALGQFAEIAA